MPDARGCEVELVLAIDTRQLGRLAADERHSRSPADLRCPLDELCDLFEVDAVRSHVVEQDQRVGAAGDHVVDAVRRHVGAAGAQSPAPARNHRLRPDRVRRRSQQPVLVERMKTRERAETARARGLDGSSQPLDDPLRRLRARPRRRRTGLRSRPHSTRSGGVPVREDARSAVRPEAAGGLAARREGSERSSPRPARSFRPAPNRAARPARLPSRRGCPRADGARPSISSLLAASTSSSHSRGGCTSSRKPAFVAMNVRRPPWDWIRSSRSTARSIRSANSSSSSASPKWSTRGSSHWPGWTTTFTAPRSSSESRSLKPILSSSSHEIPASNDWYSSPIRPCRATRPNASLPTYRASTWRTRLVTRW